jgi:tRNA U55 pseudouridine synthase TruB
MTALRRTAIGQFCVKDAIAVENLSLESLSQHLQSPLAAVNQMPRVMLTDADLIEIRHGRPIKRPLTDLPAAARLGHPATGLCRLPGPPKSEAASPSECKSAEEWIAVDSCGELVAILRQKHAGDFWPKHNFATASGAGDS